MKKNTLDEKLFDDSSKDSQFDFVAEIFIPNKLLLVAVLRNEIQVGVCVMTYSEWEDQNCIRQVAQSCYDQLKAKEGLSHE
jgi:hypothetical protein